MKQFAHPNTSTGWKCPICKSDKDSPVVLVGIPGTEDGNVMEAEQIHGACYQLFCDMHDIECEIEPLEETKKTTE